MDEFYHNDWDQLLPCHGIPYCCSHLTQRNNKEINFTQGGHRPAALLSIYSEIVDEILSVTIQMKALEKY